MHIIKNAVVTFYALFRTHIRLTALQSYPTGTFRRSNWSHCDEQLTDDSHSKAPSGILSYVGVRKHMQYTSTNFLTKTTNEQSSTLQCLQSSS